MIYVIIYKKVYKELKNRYVYMEIVKIEENKENYMHLLYEVDPDET